MNPLLRVAYNTAPSKEVGSMLHPLMQTKELPGIKDNCSHFENINRIMDFIAEHKVIVTNSYHAALWAMLANRKAVSPSGMKAGSKFNFLRHSPEFVNSWSDAKELNNAIQKAVSYPDFLDESVENILSFFSKVKAIVTDVIPVPDKRYEEFYKQSLMAELYFAEKRKK